MECEHFFRSSFANKYNEFEKLYFKITKTPIKVNRVIKYIRLGGLSICCYFSLSISHFGMAGTIFENGSDSVLFTH